MKYRTKLYLAFGGLTLGVVLLTQGINYYESRGEFIRMLRERVRTIASDGAALINKGEVEAAKEELDDQTATFSSLIQQMRQIRDANQNNMFFVKYIYLIAPDPKNPKQLIVVADATEGEGYAKPGLLYPEGRAIGILRHLNEPYTPHHLVSDRWGSFLPGYSPVFDDKGQYIATLGVNISAGFINRDLDRMLWIGGSAILIALAAGFAVATLLANGLLRSLNRVQIRMFESGKETPLESFGEDEFGDFGRALQSMAIAKEEKDRLKLHFLNNVSPTIMKKILEKGKLPNMKGEKKKITVLTSDIRHFTHFTETLTPEQAVNLLNEFMTAMYEVIFAHGGTIDKVVGDGLIVLFGAPLDDLAQETHAVETAVAMQQTLAKLNQKWDSKGRPQISMVIGIHTDQAILANIGAETHKEYTAIGHAVNTSLKVRDSAKRFNMPILISETTWVPSRNRFESKDLGPLYLKGRANSLKIYSIVFKKDFD